MSHKLLIGMKRKEIKNPSIRDINLAIDALDSEHENPFLVLESVNIGEEVRYIQVFYSNNYTNNELEYFMEFRSGTINEYKHYKKVLIEKMDVKKFFEDFLVKNKLPDPTNWKDITSEMQEYNNKHDYFNIFDVAKVNYRTAKEIINCHSIYHGAPLKETVVYQYIAEAIILAKTVLSTDNTWGEIYYTENKRQFYIDIQFPKEWQKFIPDVFRIRGLLYDKMIQVGSYKKDDSFIETNVKPLHEYEKLLACLLLVFIKNVITDDNYFYTAMNYFITSENSIFEDLYTKFVEDNKSSRYLVGYVDGGDFDSSKYLPLSKLYKNFLENLNNI